jgi:esterase/lipase superfamily enzyme
VTLYVSSRDWALNASKGLRVGTRRLGDAGSSPVVVAGVDTIDASDAQGDPLGHSYYLDTHMVRDMRSLLVDNRPARDRGLARQGGYYKLP